MSHIPQFTLDDIYISPFTHKRIYNETGSASIIPLERNLTPTGIELLDNVALNLTNGCHHNYVANRLGVDRKKLNGFIELLTGMTATEFALSYSLRIADDLLRYTDMDVKEIAQRCGLNNTASMYYIFKREYDSTPRDRRYQLRRKGDLGLYRL